MYSIRLNQPSTTGGPISSKKSAENTLETREFLRFSDHYERRFLGQWRAFSCAVESEHALQQLRQGDLLMPINSGTRLVSFRGRIGLEPDDRATHWEWRIEYAKTDIDPDFD